MASQPKQPLFLGDKPIGDANVGFILSNTVSTSYLYHLDTLQPGELEYIKYDAARKLAQTTPGAMQEILRHLYRMTPAQNRFLQTHKVDPVTHFFRTLAYREIADDKAQRQRIAASHSGQASAKANAHVRANQNV
ncbi:hypothetical protein N7468_006712 [Penicillium chermesinum]|uniref:Uncharacterized protein n=1 Tax=Penicillium chermesinum TaxID=63820 RepID=A0A9W9NSS0_9EURO|nr:uncharacterized protein N7468_006712 [Penicillium chermesinum]KAJ5225487.1 hypothetical protein N7468_006712 [Penicillium chermesinum]KAJ6161285.1 hypothetical protein N7470_004681 [Penicillium chermesinum]